MKPAIATVCIINFVTCLNNFFTPLFYSNGIQVLSVAIVQLPLRDNMYGVPWDLVSAMGWIILLPIIIFVAVFEKSNHGWYNGRWSKMHKQTRKGMLFGC